MWTWAMISADFIKIFGLLTALICALAIRKCWRLQYVPLHWLFIVAMMIGSVGIAVFYFEIDRGVLSFERLIIVSRVLWFFVLLNTALMAGSVLVYRE
jgi:hypothetical protein